MQTGKSSGQFENSVFEIHAIRENTRHKGNCLASRGLSSYAEQLSRVIEFSICAEQPS